MKNLINLGLVLFLTNLLYAANYQVSSEGTKLGFEVGKAFLTVEGQFHQFSGEANFDPDTKTLSDLQAVIQVSSVDTDNEDRDEHLQNEDFFETNTFPTIHFQSSQIDQTADGQYTVQGQLTIKSTTLPVTLKGELLEISEVNGEPSALFTATSTIDRNDFGVEYSGFLNALTHDDVDLVLEIMIVQP